MLDRIALIAGLSALGAVLVSAGPSASGPDGDHAKSISAPKGDRLAVPVAPAYRSPVASTMKFGDGGTLSVAMRDPLGKIVYLSDAAVGYTAVARDTSYADLPSTVAPVTLAAPATRPVAEFGAKIPVGCDRTVSVLTGSSAARRVSKCIT